jgi:hypothetical protein
MSRVCSEFFKRWMDARRNQEYSVSKNAEWLEQGLNLRIRTIGETYEIDYEMPCSSNIRGGRKRRKLGRWVVCAHLCVSVCLRVWCATLHCGFASRCAGRGKG